MTKEDLAKLEEIIQQGGVDSRALTWKELEEKAGLVHVSWYTIRRTMQDMDYHKCIACSKSWISSQLAMKRLNWAKDIYNRWNLEDWKQVQFSNEVHFGFGPQRKLQVIRKPGERYCTDCIQERNEPKVQKDKEQKRYHCWAMVGWNYKSELIFYNVPGNTNGKMTQQVYVDDILGLYVRPCLEAGEQFILEEDNDSGHGGRTNNNRVQRWKQEHGLRSYYNCPKSPDLSIIENCWQAVKQHLSIVPHWDEVTTKEMILEAWREKVPQEKINSLVLSMPERIHAVLDSQGKHSGF